MSLNGFIRKLYYKSTILKSLRETLGNEALGHQFISSSLKALPAGSSILDAGCGHQPYRQYCTHLKYFAQDFGQHQGDQKQIIGQGSAGRVDYGPLDYTGNIWEIKEVDAKFDAILCTEVLEHTPYPERTVAEFKRLLKPGGTLIMTVPSNCLRHMDPYFFFSGFSDRWLEKILADNGFKIRELTPVGDYYKWMAVEVARTAVSNSIFAKLFLAPAFLYYLFKKETKESVDTLCKAYMVLAQKGT